jgi:hypothetical protein
MKDLWTFWMAVAIMAVAPAVGAAQMQCQFRGAPDALAERPSPLDSVMIDLGGDAAKLCYGRPSLRGRTMIGGEDPLGSPWRFGANEPTTLHLPFPATFGGIDVEPGSYSLYAIPKTGLWTIVVNGNANRWGIPLSPDVRSTDIGSFEVVVTDPGWLEETLTFRFEGGGPAGSLVFAWERATLRIPISRR